MKRLATSVSRARRILKREFPEQPFQLRVRSNWRDSFHILDVSWTNGPEKRAVEEELKPVPRETMAGRLYIFPWRIQLEYSVEEEQ